MDTLTPTASSPADQFLAALLAESRVHIGEVGLSAATTAGRYALRHRDDALAEDGGLQLFTQPEDAEEIARYDDAGAYRPLKTAPNLRHGWRLEYSRPSFPASTRWLLATAAPAAVMRWSLTLHRSR